MDRRRLGKLGPLLFVFVVALAFAAVHQSTALVWDDSPHLSGILFENNGKAAPNQASLKGCLQGAFCQAVSNGYRPLSTFLCFCGDYYLASGCPIFLWALAVGGLTGSFLLAMYRVALRIIGSGLYAALAVLLLACSPPFVAASWIIFAGQQVMVPLFICLGLLTYWRIQDSGWKSRGGHVLLALILFLGPWFREFVGLTAILVAMLDFSERPRPTWVKLICALGLAHALFPGWVVHWFIPTAPTSSIFGFGFLGTEVKLNVATAHHGGWRELLWGWRSQLAVGHFLGILPSPIMLLISAAVAVKSIVSIAAWWRAGRPLRISLPGRQTTLVWFTVAWWLGSLLPLVKVFTEEVHLGYALVPFSILAAVAIRYMMTISRGVGVLPTSLRAAILFLAAVGVGDQVLNVPNSIRIVRGINRGVQETADRICETTAAGAIVVGNALHLEDIRLASGGHFTSYWTVAAGIPYRAERAFLTKESLADFMAKHDGTPVYFLDMDYEFLPGKGSYHAHRFVKDEDFEVQKLWSLSAVDIRYPFLDPLKHFTPRDFTNVLFAPDLENDFYRGRAVNRARFLREVYVNYTLYKVLGPKQTIFTLQGESDDPHYSPQCLIDHDRFWEVSDKHSQALVAALSRPLTLQGVRLSSGPEAVERMPSSVTLLGSADGTVWQPIETLATAGWRPSETRILPAASRKSFAHYKFEFTPSSPDKILRLYGLNLSFAEGDSGHSVRSGPAADH